MDSIGVLIIGAGVFLVWAAYKNIAPVGLAKSTLTPPPKPGAPTPTPSTPTTMVA